MTVPAFSHVGINCQNLQATEEFYTRHFGFRRARLLPLGEEQIVFLKQGSVYLELFQAKGEQPEPPQNDGPPGLGFRHLAFQVENVDAVLAALGPAAVVTLGPLDFDDFIPGWRTAWIADPDGRIVEISQGYVDEV
jgi:glyoxylase I family protein